MSELKDNIEKHRKETDVVRQRWVDPLKDMINQISHNFSAYFAAMKCAGEVTLSVPPNPVCYHDCLTYVVTPVCQVCEGQSR